MPTAYQPTKPRERLQRYGPDQLTLPELISLIIGSGSASSPVASIAASVASELVGSAADVARLAALPGVGQAKACALVAAIRLSGAVERERGQLTLLTPESVLPLCGDLAGLRQEVLLAFFCSSRGGIISRETITVGTVSSSLLHPREVFRPAIQAAASAILLVHNHPSGDPSPSEADLAATAHMAQAGKVLSIELIDHVIVAPPRHASLRALRPELFF